MPSWALVVTLGPVGGFIASGRRSRDLWWGSTWLSECVRHVALDLLDAPALAGAVQLLMPSPERVREITALVAREGMAYGGRVTNHLEVEVEAATVSEVAALADRCERTARKYLAGQLCDGLDRLASSGGGKRRERVRGALSDVLDRPLFETQVAAIEAGDFIEVHSAWAPVEESLADALRRAWKLLDGRKRARLFEPPSWTEDGRAKCDLDPGRDSVLQTANTTDRRVRGPEAGRRHISRRILGIGPEEELDALGFGRRMAIFDPGPHLSRLPFPPISRVAADPWLCQVAEDAATVADLQKIRRILDSEDVQDNPFFFTWCSPARDPEKPWERDRRRSGEETFPFDASFLFENGLDALLQQVQRMEQRVGLARSPGDLKAARRHLARLRQWVENLHVAHGVPSPYYALVMMDGDGVGHALLEQESLERRGELVAALDRFADPEDGVEKIVREHHGCAFYVGGDDIAAYLPLDRVVAAVRKIDERFAQVRDHFGPEPGVSISAGVVLAHVKADLRAVRHRAQRALATAKKERRRDRENRPEAPAVGWCTIVDLPRSGDEREAVGPLQELLGDLDTWLGLLESERLSLRSGHFLEELADRFADPSGGGDRGIELARYRLLAQRRRSDKDPGERLVERLDGITDWRLATRLAAELAVASRLRKARLGASKEAAA